MKLSSCRLRLQGCGHGKRQYLLFGSYSTSMSGTGESYWNHSMKKSETKLKLNDPSDDLFNTCLLANLLFITWQRILDRGRPNSNPIKQHTKNAAFIPCSITSRGLATVGFMGSKRIIES